MFVTSRQALQRKDGAGTGYFGWLVHFVAMTPNDGGTLFTYEEVIKLIESISNKSSSTTGRTSAVLMCIAAMLENPDKHIPIDDRVFVPLFDALVVALKENRLDPRMIFPAFRGILALIIEEYKPANEMLRLEVLEDAADALGVRSPSDEYLADIDGFSTTVRNTIMTVRISTVARSIMESDDQRGMGAYSKLRFIVECSKSTKFNVREPRPDEGELLLYDLKVSRVPFKTGDGATLIGDGIKEIRDSVDLDVDFLLTYYGVDSVRWENCLKGLMTCIESGHRFGIDAMKMIKKVKFPGVYQAHTPGIAIWFLAAGMMISEEETVIPTMWYYAGPVRPDQSVELQNQDLKNKLIEMFDAYTNKTYSGGLPTGFELVDALKNEKFDILAASGESIPMDELHKVDKNSCVLINNRFFKPVMWSLEDVMDKAIADANTALLKGLPLESTPFSVMDQGVHALVVKHSAWNKRELMEADRVDKELLLQKVQVPGFRLAMAICVNLVTPGFSIGQDDDIVIMSDSKHLVVPMEHITYLKDDIEPEEWIEGIRLCADTFLVNAVRIQPNLKDFNVQTLVSILNGLDTSNLVNRGGKQSISAWLDPAVMPIDSIREWAQTVMAELYAPPDETTLIQRLLNGQSLKRKKSAGYLMAEQDFYKKRKSMNPTTTERVRDLLQSITRTSAHIGIGCMYDKDNNLIYSGSLDANNKPCGFGVFFGKEGAIGDLW